MVLVSRARVFRPSTSLSSGSSDCIMDIFSASDVSSTVIFLSRPLIFSNSICRFCNSCCSRWCVVSDASTWRFLKLKSSLMAFTLASDGKLCCRARSSEMCISNATIICCDSTCDFCSFSFSSENLSMKSVISLSGLKRTSYFFELSAPSPLRSSMSRVKPSRFDRNLALQLKLSDLLVRVLHLSQQLLPRLRRIHIHRLQVRFQIATLFFQSSELLGPLGKLVAEGVVLDLIFERTDLDFHLLDLLLPFPTPLFELDEVVVLQLVPLCLLLVQGGNLGLCFGLQGFDLVHDVLSGSLPLLSLDEHLVHFLGLGLVVLAHVLLESHDFQGIGAAAVLVVCQVKVGQLSFVLPYFLDQSFVSTFVLCE